MNPTTPVLDLSSVVAALASFGGVAGILSMLRILFLDRLIQSMDAASQNVVLRAVNVALNFGAILLLSLAFGQTFGWPLVYSSILATVGAATASHFVYSGTKALTRAQYSSYNIPAVNTAKVEASVPVPAPTAE